MVERAAVELSTEFCATPAFIVRLALHVKLNDPPKVKLLAPVPIITFPETTQLLASVMVLFVATVIVFMLKAFGHVLPLLVRVVIPLALVIKALVPATTNDGDAESVTEWFALAALELPTVIVLFMVMVLA